LLPVNAIVDVPESSAIRNEKLLRAFRYNLTALSYISLIVGIILIYNTLTIAVVRRRAEIAMLRTLGISRSTIAGLFVLESGLVGLIGAAIGIGFGELLSRIAGVLVTRTIESLYTGFAALATAGVARPVFYVEILALGIVLSIASGIAPALRATGISPVAVLREGTVIAGRPWRTSRVSLAGLAVIVLAVVVGRQPPLFGFPILGYVSALLLIVGFGLLARPVSQLLLRAVSPPLKKIVPIEGRLATQSMRSSIGRIVTAVAALAIAVAMLISVATMVSSFRDTVRVWIDQTLRADLYIRAAAAGANDWSNPFDPETVDVLAHLSKVAAIDRFRGRPLNYKGSPIVVAAGEFAVMASYGNQLFLDGRKSNQIAPRMLNQNRVVVSEPVAIKQNMRKGSIISIPTAEGIQPFEIEDVYYDYSNDQGMIVMDRSTYILLFHDTSVTNIAAYLKPDTDIYKMQQQIAESLPNAQLRVLTNSELKQQVLRVFDQTFQVTYGLEAIALIVAILGITNILSALILERRAELAMLRFVGTDKRQLRNVVVLESGLIGLIGSALGFILGIALSVVLIFVINKQSFGWTIQFALPVAFLVQSMILIIVATILAGFYPAALAVRMDTIQSVRAE
jgi:putative ABC transport system permease protein